MINPEMAFVDEQTSNPTGAIEETGVRSISVRVVDTLAAAAEPWQALESRGVLTAYQRYEWIEAWQAHIGASQCIEPRIVVVERCGEPVMILPLGLARSPLGRIVRFLGGTHANYNLGIFAPAFMDNMDADALKAVFDAVASAGDVDLIHLGNQPHIWQGHRNPLLHLPHYPAADCAFATELDADFDALLRARRGSRGRKKMRWQQNTLKPVGGYRIIHAQTAADARRVLDAFCAQKAARFDAQGIHNVFADDGVMDFVLHLTEEIERYDVPPIELFGLEIDGKIRATYAGGIACGRFSGFFNSIATDDFTRVSPGELLLCEVIRFCCERGLEAFDLGIGESRYKTAWCDVREPLFETFIPVTARGAIDGMVFRSKLNVKRSIKQNPRLWSLALAMRKKLHDARHH